MASWKRGGKPQFLSKCLRKNRKLFRFFGRDKRLATHSASSQFLSRIGNTGRVVLNSQRVKAFWYCGRDSIIKLKEENPML
jgi:hypothetical protein